MKARPTLAGLVFCLGGIAGAGTGTGEAAAAPAGQRVSGPPVHQCYAELTRKAPLRWLYSYLWNLASRETEIETAVLQVANYDEWLNWIESGIRENLVVLGENQMPVLYRKLQRIYSLLWPNLAVDKRNIRFCVYEPSQANAAPKDGFVYGHTIYIYRGFAKTDDDTLTSIVAHELGHDQRDFLRVHLINEDEFLDMTQKQWLRTKLEMKADENAVTILLKAGYDTRIVENVLERTGDTIAESSDLARVRLEAVRMASARARKQRK